MKYKLIKKYPASPEIGTIVTKHVSLNYYLHNSDNDKNKVEYKDTIENQPEFWEKVVEKDYEILSFIATNIIYSKDSNDIFTSSYSYAFDGAIRTEEYLLQYPGTYKIYSVKRLSDGEVFSVGDNVKNTCNKEGIKKVIENFYIEKDILYLRCIDRIGVSIFSINICVKLGKPLFKTEDGVDIFEGDKYYFVCLNNKTGHKQWSIVEQIRAIKNVDHSSDNWKDFSTKEAAKEYIIMNKPCLSINEICNHLFPHTSFTKNQEVRKQIIKLVYDILKQEK